MDHDDVIAAMILCSFSHRMPTITGIPVFVGTKSTNTCSTCAVQSSPCWRKGAAIQGYFVHENLCNACGLKRRTRHDVVLLEKQPCRRRRTLYQGQFDFLTNV